MQEPIKESTFNEAALQMRRIDRIQDGIHRARMKPFETSMEFDNYNIPNCQVWYNHLISLYMEIYGKLSPTEVEEVNLKKRKAQGSINKLLSMDEKIWKFQIEKKNKIIRDITQLEMEIRSLLEKHGISAPNKEDLSKSIISN